MRPAVTSRSSSWPRFLQLTTKIWPSHYDDVAKALETSLANFGFDYVDRMISDSSSFRI